jgi:hypothetical protein
LHPIDYIGEGETDAAVARRLIEHVGAPLGRNWLDRRGPRGKQALDRRLGGFANTARHGARVLILRDLDDDAPCAGDLVGQLLPKRPDTLLLRIAIRSVEAWLMADRTGFAAAMRIRMGLIAEKQESLLHPKATLIELGRKSKDRHIRDVFSGSWQQQAGWLIDFVEDHWSVTRAAESGAAPSLRRAIARLRDLAK